MRGRARDTNDNVCLPVRLDAVVSEVVLTLSPSALQQMKTFKGSEWF